MPQRLGWVGGGHFVFVLCLYEKDIFLIDYYYFMN